MNSPILNWKNGPENKQGKFRDKPQPAIDSRSIPEDVTSLGAYDGS